MRGLLAVEVARRDRLTGVEPAEGLAHVAGLAYFGLMFGPVVIGAVAQAAGLPVGLGIVALCAAIVAVAAPKVMLRLKV